MLALLEYLVAKGYRLKVSSLQCGNGELAASSTASEQGSGEAVDISEIDGIPVTPIRARGP